MSEKPCILVASHKPYWMPNDPLYLPVAVGAAQNGPIDGFARDDEGDNISSMNPRYCELTALWWGWRNLVSDALGLVHYRRHFRGSGERGIMTGDEADVLLGRTPVVVSKRRNYYIESVASHYAHTHDASHLDALRASVRSVSPGRLADYDRIMASTGAHMFNMVLMRREVLDPYCQWLFDVLFCTERSIDFAGMTPFQERCMGRLGEFLLDVWLQGEGVPSMEVRVRELERTNWIKKGSSFLVAKFLGKKYGQSF